MMQCIICLTVENVMNSILALAAIGAAIFAGLTWRQAKKFKDNDNKSRRAYIAPLSNPGYIKTDAELGESNGIFINLQNYGINSAINIEGYLLAYNKADIDGTNINPPPIFPPYTFYATNPIPHNAELNFKHQRFSADFSFDILLTGFYVLLLKYTDFVMKCNYEDRFYWKLEDNNLVEIDIETREKLDNLVEIYLNQQVKS